MWAVALGGRSALSPGPYGPITDELLQQAEDPTPSVELAASNTAYVAAHQDELGAIITASSGLQWVIEGFGAS